MPFIHDIHILFSFLYICTSKFFIMHLHNKLGKSDLIEKMKSETFKRKTLSFYRYIAIPDLQEFRDNLYRQLNTLQCNGRIYVAHEGINAQMSVPVHHIENLMVLLESIDQLKQIPIKWALEDDKTSFLKLIVRIRNKIVADGLTDNVFDVSNVGKHLSPIEFHHHIGHNDVMVIDMRNSYESEVGKFDDAICPNVKTFREEVEFVANNYHDKKDKKILLYCTGGIRCEKASAWLKHLGFEDVNQLHGGVIAYANEMKQLGLEPKFKGKNFVFDERLGERITNDILGKCHTCGKACDTHVNCANNKCHTLLIQCNDCGTRLNNCCNDRCKTNLIYSPID